MGDRKKVLIVVTNADVGGAQNHINYLLEYLSADYDFFLLSGTNGALLQKITNYGVGFEVVPELKAKTMLAGFVKLSGFIKSEKPDIIHTHSAIASFIGRIAGRLNGVKTLYTVHGWHFVPCLGWRRRFFGWVLELLVKPFTTAWITVSDYDRDLGVSSWVIDPLRVWSIPNGVNDISVLKGKPETGGLSLVFVGRASYQKNCLEALEILSFCPLNVSLTMYVTSGDDLAVLEAAIQSGNFGHRIKLIVDDPNASVAMNQYDGILLTSFYEGMPLCLLEAMCCGLPIIASDVCGLGQVVDHGKTGFLYKIGDIQAAVGYVDLLFDGEISRELSKNARIKYKHNFAAETMALKTSEVYEKLMLS